MKIITPGITWTGLRVTCGACSCVFELDLEDKPKLISFETQHLSGETCNHLYEIDCPECGALVRFRRE